MPRGGEDGIRKVGDGEERVLVEDVAVKEPLQEVPRHWGRQLSRSSDWEDGLVVGGQRSLVTQRLG